MDPQQDAATREAILQLLLRGQPPPPLEPVASHQPPPPAPVASHPARDAVILESRRAAAPTTKRKVGAPTQLNREREERLEKLGPFAAGVRETLTGLGDFMSTATGFRDPLMDEGNEPISPGEAFGVAIPTLMGIKGLQGIAGSVDDVARAAHPAMAEVLLESRRALPKPRGSLARTLDFDKKTGLYTIRPDVQERMHKFYELGADVPSNWEGSNQELLEAFGGDAEAALQWARMWGANSPGTSAARTNAEALSAHLWKLENPGQVMTVEHARTMDPKITMAGSKVPNINRAIAGQPLSGDKVEAMAGFMAGEPRTPIDVHVLYGLGAKGDAVTKEVPALRALMTRLEKLPPRGSLTDTQVYLKYEDALRRSLQEFEPSRAYNPLFAQTWEGIRVDKGLPHQGGPLDVLRAKGLLERGAMLDPKRLKEALASKGWTASAISALLAAIYLGEDAPGAPSEPPSTPTMTAPAQGSRSAGR